MGECLLRQKVKEITPIYPQASIPVLSNNNNVIYSSTYYAYGSSSDTYRVFNQSATTFLIYNSENQTGGYIGYNFGEMVLLSSVSIVGGWHQSASTSKWKIQVDTGDGVWTDVKDGGYIPLCAPASYTTSPVTTLSFVSVACTKFRVLHYYGTKVAGTNLYISKISVA